MCVRSTFQGIYYQENHCISAWHLAITPGIPPTEKRTYGSRLIAGLMDALINRGRQGIILETIVARSNTAGGVRLMRGIGFTEIPSITDKHNLLIEVAKSGMKEIMQYK
jgi:hypothetical protein